MSLGSIVIQNGTIGERSVLLLPGLVSGTWENDVGVKSTLGWSGARWQGNVDTLAGNLLEVGRLTPPTSTRCSTDHAYVLLGHVRAGKRQRYNDNSQDEEEGQDSDSDVHSDNHSSLLPCSTSSGSSSTTTPPQSPLAPTALVTSQSSSGGSSSSSNNNNSKVISSCKWKRQRTGPSCDACRSKKIKCDATIVVVWQDNRLLSMSNMSDSKNNEQLSLHIPLSLNSCGEWITRKLPQELLKQLLRGQEDISLVRHVDKLLVCSACSSCRKKKGSTCCFTKGFTRADAAVYSNLCKKLGKRAALGDFTVSDYLRAGYTIDD